MIDRLDADEIHRLENLTDKEQVLAQCVPQRARQVN